MVKTQDPSLLFTDEEREDYWKDWLVGATDAITLEGGIDAVDTIQRSVFELMSEAVNIGQYKTCPHGYDRVERLVKIRIKLPRKAIEEMFGVETYSVYGVGLYVKMEGVLLNEYDRRQMNYDTFNKKGVYIDTSFLPEEVTQNCDFRLVVPALRGLFVPTKSQLTNWLRGTFDLQYFDMTV